MTFNSTIQSRKTQDQLLREAREEVAELRRRIFEAVYVLKHPRRVPGHEERIVVAIDILEGKR